MPLKVIDENNELLPVLSAKKILECSDEEIKQAIRYAMVVVGIRGNTIQAISEIEKQVMISFIRKNYSGHTCDEFKLAFQKAISRELPLKDNEISAYESFSCEYVGRIMSAYRMWAADYYRESGLEFKFVQEKNLLAPPEYKPIEFVDYVYQEYLRGEMNVEVVPSSVYDLAIEKLGMLVPEKRMLEIAHQAKDHVLTQYETERKELNINKKVGRYNELTNMINKLSSWDDVDCCKDIFVNRYAKALALREFFHEQKEKGVKQIQLPA